MFQLPVLATLRCPNTSDSRIDRMCVWVLGVLFLLGAYNPAQRKGAPKPWVWSRYQAGPGIATGSYTQLCIPTRRLALNSEL